MEQLQVSFDYDFETYQSLGVNVGRFNSSNIPREVHRNKAGHAKRAIPERGGGAEGEVGSPDHTRVGAGGVAVGTIGAQAPAGGEGGVVSPDHARAVVGRAGGGAVGGNTTRARRAPARYGGREG